MNSARRCHSQYCDCAKQGEAGSDEAEAGRPRSRAITALNFEVGNCLLMSSFSYYHRDVISLVELSKQRAAMVPALSAEHFTWLAKLGAAKTRSAMLRNSRANPPAGELELFALTPPRRFVPALRLDLAAIAILLSAHLPPTPIAVAR